MITIEKPVEKNKFTFAEDGDPALQYEVKAKPKKKSKAKKKKI